MLIITALAATQITYENALALAIGANIGTTITAIIGAMSANYQGKRLAAAHLIFNVVTGAIAIIFIHQIVWMVDGVSEQVGIAADDYTLKLAVFHTIFNVIGVAVMIPLVPRLVKFLQGAIPKPQEVVSEPRYINASAFDFPETLLEAVRQETAHLYDNAFDIMAKGLSFERSVILSETDLDEYTEKNRQLVAFDLDGAYNSKVKSLYADILEFISKAQTQLPPDFADHLFELRDGCLGIVTSIKEIKHLRKNIAVYIKSDNEDIRREYNKLRIQIVEMMREINELQETEEEDRDILALDEYKVAIEEDNIIATGELDALIRDERITAVMATSLMNDLGYARNAVWHLADVAKALYGAKDMMSKEAEELITLTEDDLNEMRQGDDEEVQA